MKGLMCSIYKTGNYDCTAGGVSAAAEHAVVNVEGCEIFESSDAMPALMFVESPADILGPGYVMVRKDGQTVRVKAVPVGNLDKPRQGGMFGGNFVACSDSRFPYHTPVPIFDRFE